MTSREKCQVLENNEVARGHFILKMLSPRIAKSARPGQFIQISCSDSLDPLLPRPFSFLSASSKEFSILYHVVGKGTNLLSRAKKGDVFWVLGPLGNGFTVKNLRPVAGQKQQIVLVGGGVGIPPLVHLAGHWLKSKSHPLQKNIHVFLGARHKELLLCEKDFKKLGVSLHIATDDGSKGHKGFITELLGEFLSPQLPTANSELNIYTCGPTPMLKAVSLISQKYGIACQASLEAKMACGFGACLGCAVKIRGQKTEDGRQSSEYRFAAACKEGPVFEAKEILWD